MPIYEYTCTNCHYNFELIQKINDKPVKQCPQCFEQTAVRLMSAAGFQLKGTGWYVTDFKNSNKPKDKTDNSTKNASSKDSTPAETKTTTTKGDSD